MSMPSDIRAFNRSIIEEFRSNGGRVGHEMLAGADLILLTTTGSRSGRPHVTPVAYFRDGPDRLVLWASALAAPTHPAWYLNLRANPRVTVEIGAQAGGVERFDGIAATATGGERDRLLGILRATRPEVAAHQDRTDRQIPLVTIATAVRPEQE